MMDLNNLLNSDTGRQLIKNYHSEQHENRCKMIAEIDTLKMQRNDELKTLNFALDKAQANLDEAQSRLTESETRKHTAAGDVHRATASYKAQIERVNRQLLKTAPEAINDFIIEIKQDMDDLRNTGITKTLKQSNAKSLNIRLEAMRKAITEAEIFKLLEVPDIEHRLQALRDSIPTLVMQ